MKYSIDREKIFELREQNKSYNQIREFFANDNIEISTQYIRRVCKVIYKEKGKKEPEFIKEKESTVSDDEIFELRNAGLGYGNIVNYIYTFMGEKTNEITISNRIRTINKVRKMNKPIAGVVITKKDIIIAKIAFLLSEGYGKDDIKLYFTDKNIDISDEYIEHLLQGITDQSIKSRPNLIELERKLKYLKCKHIESARTLKAFESLEKNKFLEEKYY